MKIEIIKPFDQAYNLMQKILFQPFDLKKWCIIGFASFLSGHLGGGVNFPMSWGNMNGKQTTGAGGTMPDFSALKPWLPIIIGGSILFFVVFTVFIIWLRARGNFIFTDCIVRNRASIAEPWHEYRDVGQSYFWFHLVVAVVSMMIFAILALGCGFGIWFLVGTEHTMALVLVIIATAFAILVWIVVGTFLSVVVYFTAPVMYVRRCSAMVAAREVYQLVRGNPVPFVLFCLFAFALVVGAGMITGLVTCATCCLAALPYVGTVILLPVYVCLRAYALLFLRQFGPEFDVWGGGAVFTPMPPPFPAGGSDGFPAVG